MKQSPFKNGVVFASWAMLMIFGCHRQKPPVPQEPQPPVISQQPQSQQQPQTQPTPTPTPSTTTQQPQTATTQQQPPEKPAPAHRSHPHAPKKNGNEKPATANEKPATGNEKNTTEAKNIPPPRVVIQEGGTNGGSSQMSSGQKEQAYNQSTTEQLLKGTDDNLRNLKPQLSAEEQSMLSHIRDFVKQSEQATKDGDSVRAHTLALKARLLSDELVKAR
jgi:hypothetical protein